MPSATGESLLPDAAQWTSTWKAGNWPDGTHTTSPATAHFKNAPWNFQSSTPRVVDAPAPYPDNELAITFGPNGAQTPAPGASPGSGSRRCEVEPALPVSCLPVDGRRTFCRFDIRLVRFPLATTAWNVLWQAKGDGSGSPPLELSVVAGRWKLITHNPSGVPIAKYDCGSVRTDGGADVLVFDVTWRSTGYVRAYLNDVLTFEGSAQTKHPNKGSYHKLGLYADAALSQELDVRFDCVAWGLTYDEVR